MKKITRLLPILLGLSTINLAVVGLSFIEKAEAQITPSDWVGTWSCNNDGHPPVQVTFWPSNGTVYGKIDNDYYALMPRRFEYYIDPSTWRGDHVLPLTLKSNNTRWFLVMHTWDKRYASGFSRWNYTVFGLTCTRL